MSAGHLSLDRSDPHGPLPGNSQWACRIVDPVLVISHPERFQGATVHFCAECASCRYALQVCALRIPHAKVSTTDGSTTLADLAPIWAPRN